MNSKDYLTPRNLEALNIIHGLVLDELKFIRDVKNQLDERFNKLLKRYNDVIQEIEIKKAASNVNV